MYTSAENSLWLPEVLNAHDISNLDCGIIVSGTNTCWLCKIEQFRKNIRCSRMTAYSDLCLSFAESGKREGWKEHRCPKTAAVAQKLCQKH
jgi:hypothetical protein